MRQGLTNPNKIPPKPVWLKIYQGQVYEIRRKIHKPAKADMIIAHSSDDVSMPPPVPPGPPAMTIHALKLRSIRKSGRRWAKRKKGGMRRTEVDFGLVYIGSKPYRPC